MSNLSSTYLSLEKYNEVDALYNLNYEKIVSMYGPNSPIVKDIRINLIKSLEKQGKYEEAVQLIQKYL